MKSFNSVKFGLVIMILALMLVACESDSAQKYKRVEETSWAAGEAPTLIVENFGGNITVQAGSNETFEVVATRRAAREGDLDRIEVNIDERDGGLHIKTDKPSRTNNVSVNLEITAPAGTQVDLNTGGGNVTVSGLAGSIKVHTGGGNIRVYDASGGVEADTGGGNIKISGASGEVDARTGGGNIEVQDASGLVRLDTGGGNIDYQGRPQGSCRLNTGGGNIKIKLPKDVGVQVDLDTGSGEIDVDLAVDGRLSKREVSGTIGSGEEGEIRAHTGGGNIDLTGQ